MNVNEHELEIIRTWNDDLELHLRSFRKGTQILRKEALKQWICKPGGDRLDYTDAIIRGVYGASTARLYIACRHIQKSISTRDHLAYANFSRMILEQTAMLRHLVTKIGQTLAGKSGPPTDEDFNSVMLALRTSLFGSRFSWEAFLKLGFSGLVSQADKHQPALRQTNVLTWIQAWSVKEPRIAVLYDLLCDAVHPSLGGNLLFLQDLSSEKSFTAAEASPFGDFIVWNTFKHVKYIQQHALDILGAFRQSIELGTQQEQPPPNPAPNNHTKDGKRKG